MAGPPHIAGQLAKVDLELRKDGTFELLNTSISFSGDWEYKEGKVLLDVKAALNRPAQMKTKPYLIPKAGGLELNDPSGSDSTPVMLSKVDKL